MRSCSPSLSVVPLYLISLTKDRAKIFSDLSRAAGSRGEGELAGQPSPELLHQFVVVVVVVAEVHLSQGLLKAHECKQCLKKYINVKHKSVCCLSFASI